MFFTFTYIYTNPISSLCLPKRDYSREWLSLLTVETEANGDSKSTNEKGPCLVCSLFLSYRFKRFLFCLGCSSRLSTKYFSPQCTCTPFQFLCPHRSANWAGSRYESPVYVSLRYLWFALYTSIPCKTQQCLTNSELFHIKIFLSCKLLFFYKKEI